MFKNKKYIAKFKRKNPRYKYPLVELVGKKYESYYPKNDIEEGIF